jgi:type I restriction enzyme, S subunit
MLDKELPDGWVERPIKDLFVFKYGKGLTQDKRKARGGMLVYGSNGVVGEHDEAITKGPTIIIGRKGSVGEVHLSTGPCWPIDTTYFIDEFPDGSPPEYWALYLKSLRLGQQEKSSAIPGISRDDIYRVKVAVPPLDEQRRIVAKLEELLSKVDACQKRLGKIPVILKRFRQSVLAAACSGQLTEDWREYNKHPEGASLILNGIKPDTVLLDPGDLPASWAKYKLSDISLLITKGASPKWQGINYSSTGVLFITSENIGWRRLLLDKRKYVEPKFNQLQKRSILKQGDVLTNIVGASIGRSAIFDFDETANVNQAVALVRLNESVNRNYILNVLNSPSLVERMHEEKVDVARANLSLKDVADFPIPLPPKDEQDEIVRRVEALFKFADQIEARYQKAQLQIDKLTQSILAKAFRGELVPTEVELARRLANPVSEASSA